MSPPTAHPAKTRTSRLELWYGAYALLGAVIAGLVPILLPLFVSRTGGAPQVGLVMAAVSLGMLTAPLWGALADRYRRHRTVFVMGIAFLSAALVTFPFFENLGAWLLCALVLGVGGSMTATVAGLFIVEFHPKEEWAGRVSTLQTFYGGGQVAGLTLAGLLHTNPNVGLWVAALLAATATGFAFRIPRLKPQPLKARPLLPHSSRHVGVPAAGLMTHYHLPHLRQIGRNMKSLGGAFSGFLLIWFLAVMGSSSFFSFYPTLMPNVYGVSPNLASWGYAGAVALSLFLYRVAGSWSQTHGAGRVLRAGLALRAFAYVGLGVLVLDRAASGSQAVLALALFAVVVLAWSLLSVAGTNLAAGLSQLPEGEALGFFNAVAAVAGISGSLLGSAVAASIGYGGIAWLAALGGALALFMCMRSKP